MENFIVSARKYRPQEFETVVGQSHITDTLEHAIKENQLAQALLFCGPRGVGKTTCARILARKINEKDGSISEDGFAYNIYELDAASNNSVDDIRELIDQVRFAPQVGKYKVYIIDEVHMLSTAAFNAFLKTLEEPPAHAIFILATTEKHKIIPTILSRCQIYDFKRITIEDIQSHLRKIADKEGIAYEDDALYLVAQKADGALRDALSIFDRLTTFSQKNITLSKAAEILNILDYDQYFKVVDLAKEGDIPNVLSAFNEIVQKGFDPHIFIAGLGNHFRDLMMAQHPATLNLVEAGEKTKQKYAQQALQWTPQQLVDAVEICNHADINYKNSKNPRLTVEIALMQLSSINVYAGDKKKKFLIQAPFRYGTGIKEAKPQVTVKEVTTIVASPVVETKSDITTEAAATSTARKPLATVRKSSRFSISETLNHKVEEDNVEVIVEEVQNLPADVFDQTHVDAAWYRFLKSLEDTLTLKTLQLKKKEGYTVEIHYPSDYSRNEFHKVQPEFISLLKKSTNNYHIEIVFIKDQNLVVKQESKRDKFNRYVEINPVLKDLDDLVRFDFL